MTTQPFPEAHFATFPEDLIEPMIRAGCPEFVCIKCGKARERITEVVEKGFASDTSERALAMGHTANGPTSRGNITPDKTKTAGWTDCGCNAGFVGGIVLDPFAGSGTTGVVALRQGKRFIGIDLNQSYTVIAEKRIKPEREQEKLTRWFHE